jgi:hypothetical protein
MTPSSLEALLRTLVGARARTRVEGFALFLSSSHRAKEQEFVLVGNHFLEARLDDLSDRVSRKIVEDDNLTGELVGGELLPTMIPQVL